jgi:hypothetical protein
LIFSCTLSFKRFSRFEDFSHEPWFGCRIKSGTAWPFKALIWYLYSANLFGRKICDRIDKSLHSLRYSLTCDDPDLHSSTATESSSGGSSKVLVQVQEKQKQKTQCGFNRRTKAIESSIKRPKLRQPSSN